MGGTDSFGGPTAPLRWQELVGELSSLYEQSFSRALLLEQMEVDLGESFTRARNEDLEKRVKELEREVAVWRQAHERECVAKEAMLGTINGLNRELAGVREDAPLVVCLIDGDGTIFAQEYLLNGQVGGRTAAQALHRGMLEYLGPASTRATVCTTVYFNRTGLRDILARSNICTYSQFDAFWIGFVQAASMFQVVDVGPGKEAADAKLREALRTYSRMPQTMLVFFGGAHDAGYRPPLQALALNNSLDKVVLIQAHDEIAYELRALNLQTVKWGGLFISHKIGNPRFADHNASGSPRPGTPLNRSGSPRSSTPNTPRARATPEPLPGMRSIDPRIPLAKQVPPPCNFYYLSSTCLKGDDCTDAHNYMLTSQQLATLRNAAKKTPCSMLNNGTIRPLPPAD
ncbi:hypothetical protein EXIGLDRAFT_831372 [Exidia glandulosa HHB12029]|uniref:C3H1-type domain-containing protein n=1 Tax=Exidia glandulosa HHB12029 TaxID=1314781 RepID=A0A165MR73_EXIGL|nr:hypothetical protein EXIGLDRAFT_831372 [Exidia glandulosa HHB12029]